MMKTDKILKFALILSSVLCAFSIVSASVKMPEKLEIWSGRNMPGNATEKSEGFLVKNNEITNRIANVSTPTLEFFFAENENPTGFVIVCPGGGYYILSYEHEGREIAKKLQSIGVSAAVLKYRVPDQFESALMDAQRAVKLVRANAKEWNVDPSKIGIMGFSAGANLSARVASFPENLSYKPVDKIDSVSSMPNFVGLIYPAWLNKAMFDKWHSGVKNFSENIPEKYSERYALADITKVEKDSPPAFIAQSMDDKTYVDSSVAYCLARKQVGAETELHLYPKGGHGYGDGSRLGSENTAFGWFDCYAKWLAFYKFSK